MGIGDNLQVVGMVMNWDDTHKGMDYIVMNDYNCYPFYNTNLAIAIAIAIDIDIDVDIDIYTITNYN